MRKIWYDPEHPDGFGGIDKLTKNVIAGRSKTAKWLSGELAYSLNKPMLKRFPTRAYKTFGVDDLWQMDLMEMIPFSSINKGYKYILTCIDVFSRFARAIPLKSKSANDVEAAVELAFSDGHPDNVQTDLGKEFYNSKVKAIFDKRKINHYTVHSQYKAAHVERFNRTLRDRLKKYFVAQGNKKWVTVLPQIINSYNNSIHRSINMKPTDVTSENALKLWKQTNVTLPKKPKYSVDDFVRISKISASPFIKNFNNNWSDEVFQIDSINSKQNPVMYVIRDFENNIVEGKFYEQELQVIPKPNTFRIQKILKSRKVGKHKQLYVKWHGYETPTWIAESDLVK